MVAMSDPASSDRLRHGALAMLADGNSVEAVAQLMAVPVDAVRAWRDSRQPAAEPDATPRTGAFGHPVLPPMRFDEELSYGLSTSARVLMVVLGCGMALAGGLFAVSSLRAGHVAHGLQGLLMAFPLLVLQFHFVPRVLVLGREGVSEPGFFGRRALAYSDIADYRLCAHRQFMGRAFRTGQMLTVLPRTPGVAPLTAFLADDDKVDARIFVRLGSVVRANRAAAAAQAAPGKSIDPGAHERAAAIDAGRP